MSREPQSGGAGTSTDAPQAASKTEAYLAELRAEFPGLRIIEKLEHPWSQRIDKVLRALTLGGQSAYVSTYTTVLGRTIYLPASWSERSDDARYITLRHEAVHLRQFRRYGMLGMTLIYGLPILPVGLSVGRTWIEWRAYQETLRAYADVYGPAAAADPKLHAYIKLQFTGPAYLFMWPFPRMLQRMIDREVQAIEARHAATPA